MTDQADATLMLTQRLAALALDAQQAGSVSTEVGCLMLAEVLRLPPRAQAEMANTFFAFTQALRSMQQSGGTQDA
jgi:hypothetical protein